MQISTFYLKRPRDLVALGEEDEWPCVLLGWMPTRAGATWCRGSVESGVGLLVLGTGSSGHITGAAGPNLGRGGRGTEKYTL